MKCDKITGLILALTRNARSQEEYRTRILPKSTGRLSKGSNRVCPVVDSDAKITRLMLLRTRNGRSQGRISHENPTQVIG